MATIVLSAIGTAIGGPLGGALGALVGNQVDRLVFSPDGREGPRLKDLSLTTSSYGTPIARHHGRVRAAGSVIWGTDLVESSENSGGGKGRSSTTSFSYSTSFAVALASRPIESVGRIWADGNLLRGAAGDLKVGGELRIYRGYGDQQPDPLIASDKGAQCPAFRGLAYCVFESLQLADFGNRIPALTFEIVADNGDVSLTQVMQDQPQRVDIDRPLTSLRGFSEEGGPLAASLAVIDAVYPFSCDASGQALTISPSDTVPADPLTLPEPAADPHADGFAPVSGQTARRRPDSREIPDGIRYYDIARDFQPGLQRAEGRARPGYRKIVEFPGSLDAGHARDLINRAAERSAWSREHLSWRLPELDPELRPGSIVRVPGRHGYWRIEQWEWCDTGIELELQRLPGGPARSTTADAGVSLPAPDSPVTPTLLEAAELPWDGQGSGTQRHVVAAASSISGGWAGAQIYADEGGALTPLGATGRRRSVIGQTTDETPARSALLLDRTTRIEVALASEDFQLLPATLQALANGANRALLGEEIIQFAHAERLDGAIWRISHILRGRGGTEAAAGFLHAPGAPFVLLDGAPVPVDTGKLGSATTVAALGLADADPVIAPIRSFGRTLRPLTPVHARAEPAADGSLSLRWARRARGSWDWLDSIEVPLNEESEAYLVGLGDPVSPDLYWETAQPVLEMSPSTLASLQADHSGKTVWVRQVGSHSASDPLLLFTIP